MPEPPYVALLRNALLQGGNKPLITPTVTHSGDDRVDYAEISGAGATLLVQPQGDGFEVTPLVAAQNRAPSDIRATHEVRATLSAATIDEVVQIALQYPTPEPSP